MPIKFSCAKCQKSFVVADSSAGKQGQCKDCGHLNTIPQPTAPEATIAQVATAQSDSGPTRASAEGTMFEVKSGATGAVFGPADRATLNQWVQQNRITSDCKIKKVGSQKWTAASSVFSALEKEAPVQTKLQNGPNAAGGQTLEKIKSGQASGAKTQGEGGASTAVNPFASGTVSNRSFEHTGEFAPRTGKIGFILSHAIERYKQSYGVLIGAFLLSIGTGLLLVFGFYLFAVVAIFVGGPANNGIGMGFLLMVVLFYILYFIAAAYLGTGLTQMTLRVGRGEPVAVMDLFAPGNRFLYVLGHGLVANALVFGCLMAVVSAIGFLHGAAGPDGGGVLEGVAVVLALLTLGSLVLLMWPGMYLVVDRRAGILGAIGLGFSVAIKNIAQFMVISLVAGLVYLAGGLMLGVGIIITLPLAMLILACAYLNMTGQIGDEPNSTNSRT